ncbi:MAG: O-antigen ligase family protein [Ignavibacteria bacterium]|nr:O-antigen ligase family protein [Ignavibacteria bacterium]
MIIDSKFLKKINSIILFFLFIHLTAVSVSIALASISFGIWGGLWIVELLIRKKFFIDKRVNKILLLPNIFLIIYIVSEILSRIFAVIPEGALIDLKRLLLFAVFFVAIEKFDDSADLLKFFYIMIIFYSLLSTFEILKFFFEIIFGYKTLDTSSNRLGYFTHPITTGELKMLIFLTAFPLLFASVELGARIRYLILFLLIPIFISMILTFSRNVIFAVVICLFFFTLLQSRKVFLILILVFIGIWFISPNEVKDRYKSIFDANHISNKARIVMWETGLKIFKDYPILGTGDNEFREIYKRYKKIEYEAEGSHLHNNFLMILVTTGVIGFTGFIGFMVSLLIRQIEIYKKTKRDIHKKIILGSILALISLNLSGLFECNFTDWEVASIFLFNISFPFIIFKTEKK